MIVGRVEDQDQSEYLFQPRQNSTDLDIFNIREKKLKTIELDFAIPHKPGFCHVNGKLYLGGGSVGEDFFNDFCSVTSGGKV